jgi:heat shock protein HslJ
MRTLLIVVAALLVLAGCGERPAGDAPVPVDAGDTPDSLIGKTFVLASATEKGDPLAIVSGTTIELRFTADGRLVANAGCNTMTGPATVTADGLDADLSTTEMACDDARHAQDEWLSTLLTGKPAVRMEGDQLTLSARDAELMLVEQQAMPLHDTTWTVTTLVEGQTAAAATTEATLTFGDGEVTVTGLCNLKAVKYQESGPTLTFELGMLTRMACAPEIMTVENATVRVLDGEATYEVDGTTLTITKGDQKLQLTGQ